MRWIFPVIGIVISGLSAVPAYYGELGASLFLIFFGFVVGILGIGLYPACKYIPLKKEEVIRSPQEPGEDVTQVRQDE